MKELKYIKSLHPCEEAVEYLETKETFKQAWEDCHRGDWMFWLAKRVGVDIKPLTKAKALCALTVRHLMQYVSIKACELALKFANGEATKMELEAADAADFDSYITTAAAAAADAAAAAYAAAAAADAAADFDSYITTAAAARRKNELETANICREVLTEEVFEKMGL